MLYKTNLELWYTIAGYYKQLQYPYPGKIQFKILRVKRRLIWDYLEELKTLAEQNGVKLVWVAGHQWIEVNEKADELAKGES